MLSGIVGNKKIISRINDIGVSYGVYLKYFEDYVRGLVNETLDKEIN